MASSSQVHGSDSDRTGVNSAISSTGPYYVGVGVNENSTHPVNEYVDNDKKKYIIETLLKQINENTISEVFLDNSNLKKPLYQIYEMLKCEENEKDEAITMTTMTDWPCTECDMKDTRIEELQKIQTQMGNACKDSKEHLIAYKVYMEENIPKLIVETINMCHPDGHSKETALSLVDTLPAKYQDLFFEYSKKIMETVHIATNELLDASMDRFEATTAEMKLKHTREINKFQDKIMSLQQNFDQLQKANIELEEQQNQKRIEIAQTNEEIENKFLNMDSKVLKYKRIISGLKKENQKLQCLISDFPSDTNWEQTTLRINEGLKKGDLWLTLKAKNEQCIREITEAMQNKFTNTHIGDAR